jgi:hypothetical protein
LRPYVLWLLSAILGPLQNNSTDELLVAIVAIPLVLDVLQFWIQDSILRYSKSDISDVIVPV